MSDELRISAEHETLSDADRETIRSGLDATNDAAGRTYRPKPFAFTLRSADGDCVGGAEGVVGPHWAYVATLWVHPDSRGDGWGERLMAAVEGEAQRRGCTGVCLVTFTHQAPGFYERLGYEEYARLDEWPEEHRIHYAKRLAPFSLP